MEEYNKLIQEKNLLDVFEKYSDLQIKYEKEDKHYINVKIEQYVICLEYNWKQEIWMSIQHTIIDKNNEERDYPIFPNAKDVEQLIYDKVKFVKGKYIISSSTDSWPQTVGIILSNIKKNITVLYQLLNNCTLRFPDGIMKIRRKSWKSPAIIADIHQESKKDFVQGVKKDEHSLSDNSHSPDVIQEEKCHVLKYKVHGPRQELFHYANVDKFIRDFYLPKNKEERMSAKLLEEINQRIANLKLDVITQDVDESGEASVYAKYLPQGFDSWEDYLKTVF